MADEKRKKITLLKSQTGLPANIIDIQKYFTAEFGHLQYAEVQNNSNDEVEEDNCFWIMFSNGEIDGVLFEDNCVLSKEEIEKIEEFLVKDERNLILERVKNYTLKETTDALEEYFFWLRFPFMLRSVDIKTGKVLPLSQEELEKVSRKADFVFLLLERLKTIIGEKDCVDSEYFAKQIGKFRESADKFREMFLKIEDREEAYFLEVKGKMERIIEMVNIEV